MGLQQCNSRLFTKLVNNPPGKHSSIMRDTVPIVSNRFWVLCQKNPKSMVSSGERSRKRREKGTFLLVALWGFL